MKKIFFLIISILFIDNVHAENILDNYNIDVKIDDTKVHIKETFDVVTITDNKYIKESFIDLEHYKLVESNLNEFKIIDEESPFNRPFFTGTIKPNKSYLIEYITDYDKFGNGAYSFETPLSTTINNLTFKIEHNKKISSVRVYGYNEGSYEITEDGNIMIGKLVKKNSDADFRVLAYKEKLNNKNEEKTSNIGAHDYIIMFVFLGISILVYYFLKKIYL